MSNSTQNDRVPEASKTIRNECLPSDGTLYTQGQLDKAVADARKELIGKVSKLIQSTKKDYWHIRFVGVDDADEKRARDDFNKEVTLLINSVLDDVLATLKEEKI